MQGAIEAVLLRKSDELQGRREAYLFGLAVKYQNVLSTSLDRHKTRRFKLTQYGCNFNKSYHHPCSYASNDILPY